MLVCTLQVHRPLLVPLALLLLLLPLLLLLSPVPPQLLPP